MPTFIITRTIKHTEVAEVEAIDKWEAMQKADDYEYVHQNDDRIHYEEISETK